MSTQPFLIVQATSIEIRDGQLIREMRESVLKSRVQGPPPIKNPTVAKLADAAKKEQTEADRKKLLLEKDAATKPVGEELDAGDNLASAAGEQVAAENEKALNLPTDGSAAASESKFNPIHGLPLLLLLGGSASGSNNPTSLTRFNGLVLDGYIRGATVYLDSNNDGLQSPGESVTISTPSGTFSVQGPAAAPFIGYGGTDTATGLPNLLTLYAPAGYSILSPLTSLVYFASLQAGISAADAQSLIKAALGLSASIDLATFDPFATPTSIASLAVQKVTAEVAIVLSLAPDAATQSVWLQGLAQQAASKAALSQTLDLSSAALFQSLGMPTAMAQKVADIYKLIQAADSIADVTTIQRAALDGANDAPSFLAKLITATVAENSAIGTLLTTVAAIDPDQGNSVSYTLVGPDAAKLSINSIGEIRLAVIPDYEGQTSFSFTVVASDVLGAFSSKAGTVNIIDAPTGAVSISGSAIEGQTLTAVTTNLADADGLGVLNYLWQRSADGSTGWTGISGATATSYILVNADSNQFVRVLTSYVDGHGTTESVASTALARVINVLAAPLVSLATDTGANTSDDITSIGTLNVSAPEAGATIQYSINGGTAWSSSFTAVEGSNVVQVRQIDGFANASPTTSLSFTLDTTASVSRADITDAQDSTLPVTGNVPNGGASNETALVLSGTVDAAFSAVAGDEVVVYDASTEIGIAVVTGSTWAFTTPTLADALHSFTVIVRDVAGNLGDVSVEYVVALDTTAPAKPPPPMLDAGSDLGFNVADNLTSDATPTINVSATLVDGEVLHLYMDDGFGGASVEVATFAVPAGSSLPYVLSDTYTPSMDLGDGSYIFSAQVTDAAGNASLTATSAPVVIDSVLSTSQATVDQAIDDIGLFTGLVGHLDTDATPYAYQSNTNDTSLSLSGSLYNDLSPNPVALIADEKVAIYDSGLFLGYSDADTGDTTWTYEASIIGDGTHAFTARVVSASGAPGDESATLQVVLNTTTPDSSLDFHSGVGGSTLDISALGSYGLNDADTGTLTLDAYALADLNSTSISTAEVLAISDSFTSGSLDPATDVATDLNAALAANSSSSRFQLNADLILLLKDITSPTKSVVWRYQDGSAGAPDGFVQSAELTRLGDISFASDSSLELLLAENFKL